MKDLECVHFLQWALPQLHMKWSGFRKVRSQVCKRLQRQLSLLHLDNLHEYKRYLEKHEGEWSNLDNLCQITISRFYRDKMVFAFLEEQVFPRLLYNIEQRQESELRIWCIGSGAGEEPYTLALLWANIFQSRHPTIRLSIVGTEINPEMIKRAQLACYPYSAIKNLPPDWQESAFDKHNDQYCLRSDYKRYVDFHCQDLREGSPTDGKMTPFHLICCRNLAFTYFDTPLQQSILQRLHARLENSGILMIGVHEELPPVEPGLTPWSRRLGIYLRSDTD